MCVSSVCPSAEALKIVSEVATHVNETIRQMVGFKCDGGYGGVLIHPLLLSPFSLFLSILFSLPVSTLLSFSLLFS